MIGEASDVFLQICNLKLESCKLYNKQMSRFIRNNKHGNFAFIAVLVFKLLSLTALFINRKDNRNVKTLVTF